MLRFVVLGTLLLLLPLGAQPAVASFHLWKIDEIFSNASGTVQFIELHDDSAGEELLAGHHLTTDAHDFMFPTNLPSDQTANHNFLLGTAAYAALAGAPAPDYIIPANFFAVGGDTLHYAGVDTVSFGAGVLPVDGLLSLTRHIPKFDAERIHQFADEFCRPERLGERQFASLAESRRRDRRRRPEWSSAARRPDRDQRTEFPRPACLGCAAASTECPAALSGRRR